MATTLPQAAGAAGAPDPDDTGGSGASDDSQQAQSGYVICIHVGGDGTLSVGTESDQEEAQEAQGGSGDDAQDMEDYEPAKNIKDALTMALEIYRNDGQMPSQADSNFQQGFDGGSGASAGGGM